jgi:ABC-2 type transport system permease protein
MNTPSNSMDEVGTHVPAPDVANIPARTLLYWSIRREIWENRSVYIAPLATAILFLFACLIATAHMGVNFFDVNLSDSDGAPRGHLINALTAVTCMVFVVSVIVGFFYSLDSLYGERRDRSILFWKSLPVSDLITVIAKIVVPLVILPALAFAVIVVAQFVMMLLGSAVLAAHGQSVGDMWSAASIVQSWLVLLYTMIALSLWYAPLVGWLLLVSAWAQRLAILWAILLPMALCAVEGIGLGSSHLGGVLVQRIAGASAFAFDINMDQVNAFFGAPQGSTPPEWARGLHGVFGLTPDPLRFLSSPALWLGLIAAALMFAGAIRLRRSREAL